MRAWEIQSWGNIKLVERELAPVEHHSIRIRMLAASLNYRDLLTISGKYNPRQSLPLIPFSDGVGEVIEVGDGVTRVDVGDRVCPIFCQEWHSGRPTRDKIRSTLGGPLDGVLQEEMVLPEDGVVIAPPHLSNVEAASLPCAAVTAWSALVSTGDVRAGDTILVQGTGGVAIFALQFGKILGAHVIVTSSSDEKLERVRNLGADDVINYVEDPRWGKTAFAMTGRGVDHIVELGGAGTLSQSLRAIKVGGHISLIGVLAGGAAEVNLVPLTMKAVQLQGILVGSRSDFEQMNRAISQHRLHPVVDRIFDFMELPAALERMQVGKHFGKIVLEL